MGPHTACPSLELKGVRKSWWKGDVKSQMALISSESLDRLPGLSKSQLFCLSNGNNPACFLGL